MPGIAEVLTRKLGPLPVWAWGAIGLGGAYLLYRSGVLKSLGVGSSGSGTTPTPPAPSGADTALLQQELGMLQQIQGYQGQSGRATTSGWTARTRAPIQGPAGPINNIPISSDTSGKSQIGSLPPDSPVNLLNQGPVSGTWGGSPATYYQVSVPGGGVGYVLSQDLLGLTAPGGVGGARAKRIPARSLPHAAMGGPSRLGSAHGIWRAGHPMLGGPRAAAAGPADVTYPHYAMGGARNVHQVAAHMGIHPARVLAVNGHVKAGQARPGQIIRVV